VHPCGKSYSVGLITKLHNIKRLKSISEILPAYQDTKLSRRAKSVPYDPYADAMRPQSPGNSASVEDIKATWSVARVLGLPEPTRRTTRLQCPIQGCKSRDPFVIYNDKSWFCFSHQEGGDVIDLYAALHNISLQDAIREMSNE